MQIYLRRGDKTGGLAAPRMEAIASLKAFSSLGVCAVYLSLFPLKGSLGKEFDLTARIVFSFVHLGAFVRVAALPMTHSPRKILD
jgi:hypothetical protein